LNEIETPRSTQLDAIGGPAPIIPLLTTLSKASQQQDRNRSSIAIGFKAEIQLTPHGSDDRITLSLSSDTLNPPAMLRLVTLRWSAIVALLLVVHSGK
jgi:hypothetical protein